MCFLYWSPDPPRILRCDHYREAAIVATQVFKPSPVAHAQMEQEEYLRGQVASIVSPRGYSLSGILEDFFVLFVHFYIFHLWIFTN